MSHKFSLKNIPLINIKKFFITTNLIQLFTHAPSPSYPMFHTPPISHHKSSHNYIPYSKKRKNETFLKIAMQINIKQSYMLKESVFIFTVEGYQVKWKIAVREAVQCACGPDFGSLDFLETIAWLMDRIGKGNRTMDRAAVKSGVHANFSPQDSRGMEYWSTGSLGVFRILS